MTRLPFVIPAPFLAGLQFLLLYFSYRGYVQPTFGYAGLESSIESSRLLSGLMISVLFSLALPMGAARFSSAVLAYLTIFLVIPVIAYWAASGVRSDMLYLVLGSILTTGWIARAFPALSIPRLAIGYRVGLFACVGLVAIFVFLVLRRGGIAFLNFNLSEVYEYRAYVHESVLGGIAGYLWANLGKAVLPILLCVFLMQDRRFLALAVIVAQLFLFGLTSHKELIFYPLAILFAYLHRKRAPSEKLVHGFYCYVLVALLISLSVAASGFPYAANLLVMRGFVSAPFNHFEYFRFFETNPHIYWSNSLLETYIKYPYQEAIADVIGFGRYDATRSAHANTGYIAMGYAHARIAGVMLYSIVLGFILRLSDSMFPKGEEASWWPAGIGFVVAMQLIATDISTALLSHGLALTVVLAWLFDRSSSQPGIGKQLVPKVTS